MARSILLYDISAEYSALRGNEIACVRPAVQKFIAWLIQTDENDGVTTLTDQNK